ncbi:hypothetical protein Dsin_018479 [Dipteronia sinensis]|uniref:Uncharacterized protein n=1 Tax=Dipteronia sinensis TaxID=43782 RepID=A0AAE0E1Z1_9ROSI|nr:hypothetical protein Dsin_018479 [Dipteronia sinensis]
MWGVSRNWAAMAQLREAVDECGLIDMGSRGYKFIWANRQSHGNLIQERLDRMLCSMDWRLMFPDACVIHSDHEGSDHKPMLVDNICKWMINEDDNK